MWTAVGRHGQLVWVRAAAAAEGVARTCQKLKAHGQKKGEDGKGMEVKEIEVLTAGVASLGTSSTVWRAYGVVRV